MASKAKTLQRLLDVASLKFGGCFYSAPCVWKVETNKAGKMNLVVNDRSNYLILNLFHLKDRYVKGAPRENYPLAQEELLQLAYWRQQNDLIFYNRVKSSQVRFSRQSVSSIELVAFGEGLLKERRKCFQIPKPQFDAFQEQLQSKIDILSGQFSCHDYMSEIVKQLAANKKLPQ